MPTESSFASVDIPNVDLWGLMFERKDRGFADDQGAALAANLWSMSDAHQ
jgi:4-coumarate--CoA ligase